MLKQARQALAFEVETYIDTPIIVTPEELLEQPGGGNMNRDPVVEEVHQIRQKLLEACGGDLDRLLDRLKAAEIQDRSRVVAATSLPTKTYVMKSTESAVRSLLGAIPFAGTALNEAIFDLRARLKQERLVKFVEYLADIVRTLESDKIDTAYIQSEAFVDFLEDVLIRATKTRAEEKRKKLAAVLAGRLQHAESTPFDDRFLDLLLSLTEIQVRILAEHLHAAEEREKSEKDATDVSAEHRQPSYYDLSDSDYRFLVQDLISKALLYCSMRKVRLSTIAFWIYCYR